MATYYLGTTGNDSTGDGSYGNPWATISKANTSAVANDTIIYKNGTYTIGAGQTFTKGLTIKAETAGSVILDCANTPRTWVGAITNTMVIQDLIFYRWKTSGNTYTFGMGYATYTNNIYRDCFFENSSDGLGYTGFIGFNGSAPTIVVQNCLWDNYWTITYAGQIFSIRGDTQNGTMLVKNCTFYLATPSFAGSGLVSRYDASTNSTFTMKNCIVRDLNAIYNNSKQATSFTVTYSNSFGMLTALTGTGVLNVDPLFIDPSTKNYQPRPSSPCIDSGSNT